MSEEFRGMTGQAHILQPVRRRLTAMIAAVMLVGLVSGSALGATNPTIAFLSPSPAENATLTSNSVSFAFTYNRTPKATSSVTCALSGPTASSGACDAPVASGKGSRSGESYSSLANGAYTFTVSLRLTDGGTASATRHFTVNVPTGHVYWTNVNTGTIGRANLDGSGADQSFISGASYPSGVAVDAGHVYWTNFVAGTIGRANLDGSNPDQSFITGASGPWGVAVDAGHIYWTNFFTATIGRANLDGTDANQGFITTAGGSEGVAVDANHIYWGNDWPGTIGRADLDGSNANQSFITSIEGVAGVAVDANHIYWGGRNTGTVGRANLDGSSPEEGFTTSGGTSRIIGVAVDTGHIFWVQVNTGTIGRANLDGTDASQSFITGISGAYGVAVDAGS
jgi:virginiamycin B lyase